MMMSRKMRWARAVTRMREKMNACRVSWRENQKERYY
jgi:hypothetical protein